MESIFSFPDGQNISIDFPEGTSQREMNQAFREIYKPTKPMTKDEAKQLPPGIVFDLATGTGEGVDPSAPGATVPAISSVGGDGYVLAEQAAMPYKFLGNIIGNGYFNKDQEDQLIAAADEAFYNSLEEGHTYGSVFKRGIRQSGFGALRSLYRQPRSPDVYENELTRNINAYKYAKAISAGEVDPNNPTGDWKDYDYSTQVRQIVNDNESSAVPFDEIISGYEKTLKAKEPELRESRKEGNFDRALTEIRSLASAYARPDADTFLGDSAEFITEAAGATLSPESLISLGGSTVAKGLFTRIGVEAAKGAAENVAAEVLIAPLLMKAGETTGEDYNLAANIAFAGAGGATLRGLGAGMFGKGVDASNPSLSKSPNETRAVDVEVDTADASIRADESADIIPDVDKKPILSSEDLESASEEGAPSATLTEADIAAYRDSLSVTEKRRLGLLPTGEVETQAEKAFREANALREVVLRAHREKFGEVPDSKIIDMWSGVTKEDLSAMELAMEGRTLTDSIDIAKGFGGPENATQNITAIEKSKGSSMSKTAVDIAYERAKALDGLRTAADIAYERSTPKKQFGDIPELESAQSRSVSGILLPEGFDPVFRTEVQFDPKGRKPIESMSTNELRQEVLSYGFDVGDTVGESDLARIVANHRKQDIAESLGGAPRVVADTQEGLARGIAIADELDEAEFGGYARSPENYDLMKEQLDIRSESGRSSEDILYKVKKPDAAPGEIPAEASIADAIEFGRVDETEPPLQLDMFTTDAGRPVINEPSEDLFSFDGFGYDIETGKPVEVWSKYNEDGSMESMTRAEWEESGRTMPVLSEEEAAPFIGDLSANTFRGTKAISTEDVLYRNLENAHKRTGVEEWADKVIAESVRKLSAGVDPALMAAYAVKGLSIFNRGIKNFSKWSAEMVKRYGSGITDKLKGIYDTITEWGTDRAVWSRQPFIRYLKENISDAVEVDDISRRLQMFSNEADGRLNIIANRDVLLIQDKMRSLAKAVGTTYEKFREQANTYGQAVHALELNRVHGDGSSGMTNELANQIINSTSKRNKTAYESYLNELYAINNEALDLRLNAGMLDRELYDKFKSMYKKYVPFYRVMDEDSLSDSITDPMSDVVYGGQQLYSTGIKRFKGSDRAVNDLLGNSLKNFEDAVRRAKANEADRLIANSIIKYADEYGEGFSVRPVKVIASYETDGGARVPVYEENPKKSEGYGIRYFDNGKRMWIIVKDENIKRSMDGTNVEHVSGIMNALASVTAFRSYMLTAMSANFVFLTNPIRDTQSMLFNSGALLDKRITWGQWMRDVPESFGAGLLHAYSSIGQSRGGRFVRDLLGDSMRAAGRSDITKKYQMFIEDGGSAGGRMTHALHSIEESLGKFKNAKGLRHLPAIEEALNLIDALAPVTENMNRFMMYQRKLEESIKKGIPIEKARELAAHAARESTFDPSKKGIKTRGLSALYNFVNPSIQSAERLRKTIAKNPTMLLHAAFGIGALKTIEFLWNQQIDPTWHDGVPDYRKRNINLIVDKDDKGNTHSISLPIGYEFAPLAEAYNKIMRSANGYKEESAAETTYDLMKSVIDGYSVIDASSLLESPDGNFLADFIETTAPSTFVPLIQLLQNRQRGGASIRVEKKNLPAAWSAPDWMYDTASGKAYINIAQDLHEASGGKIGMSPADMRFLVQAYGGGAARTAENFVDLVGGKESDDRWVAEKLPLLNALFKFTDKESKTRLQNVSDSLLEAAQQQAIDQTTDQRNIRNLAEKIAVLVREGKKKEADELFQKAVMMTGEFRNPDGQVNRNKAEYLKNRVRLELTPMSDNARLLADFGIEDGQRANQLFKLINVEFKGDKEKADKLWKEIKENGILTPKVEVQYMILLRKEAARQSR